MFINYSEIMIKYTFWRINISDSKSQKLNFLNFFLKVTEMLKKKKL